MTSTATAPSTRPYSTRPVPCCFCRRRTIVLLGPRDWQDACIWRQVRPIRHENAGLIGAEHRLSVGAKRRARHAWDHRGCRELRRAPDPHVDAVDARTVQGFALIARRLDVDRPTLTDRVSYTDILGHRISDGRLNRAVVARRVRPS